MLTVRMRDANVMIKMIKNVIKNNYIMKQLNLCHLQCLSDITYVHVITWILVRGYFYFERLLVGFDLDHVMGCKMPSM